MRLGGKVALISGAASGMGLSMAGLFAAEGARVALLDRDAAAGEAAAAGLRGQGGAAIFIQADVTRDGDWRRAIASTLEAFGGLTVLVNNAGISGTAFPDHEDEAGWETLLAVNAKSVFLGTRHAVAPMKAAGAGSIVNISSIFGIVGGDGSHPGYYAAKAAVRTYTKSAAVRYGPFGIRVNSIHPGYMEPMRSAAASHRSPERMRAVLGRTPLGRTGRSGEVAAAALFLASDDASYITGVELPVDGGFLAA